MIKREIYEISAKIVDASGAYNNLSGYPKTIDSHQLNDDCKKSLARAYGEYYSALGAMAPRDDRQKQFATIIRVSDGMQIEKKDFGSIAGYPDPTYAVTVTNGSGSGSYIEGARVNIYADEPEEGKQFKEWEGADGIAFVSGSANSSNAAFLMIPEAVSLTATYEDIPYEDISE